MHPLSTTFAKGAETPPTGLLLVIASFPAMLAYLALATIGCVGMFGGSDVAAMLGSAIWVLFGGYFTWLHYRAVFRAELSAAKDLTRWYLFFSALLGFSIAILAFILAVAPQPYLVHLATSCGLVLIFAICTWSLLAARSLELTTEEDVVPAAQRYSLREVMLAVTVAACVLGVSSYVLKLWQARLVEHVAAADCPFPLPAAARDVSYCYSPWGQLAYEFSIDQEGAAEWAASLDLYLVQPIMAASEIKRFGYLHPRLQRDQRATISSGWQAAGYVDGKQVMIAYDEEAKRAYYFMTEP